MSGISRHSSVERYIGPDATITLDFALARMTGVIEKLVVYPERMQKNLDATHGLVHSQRVLLALTQAGLAREDSYRLVQKNAMRAWNGEGNLLDLLKADPDVSKALPAAKLEAMFDLGYHLKAGGHDLQARLRLERSLFLTLRQAQGEDI